jgi:C4-dicarboxylate-binding protein DctP
MRVYKLFILFILLSTELFAKYVIIFSHVTSDSSPKGIAANLFAKRVNELSKGEIEVKVFSQGKLCQDKHVLKKVKENTIQMAAPSFSIFSEELPQLAFFDLPFLFRDIEQVHNLFDGDLGKDILNLVSEHGGYVALTFWDNGFKQITNSKRPIRLPKDISNLKFRIMRSRILVEQFKTLNSIPIILPFTSVYSALKYNVIDGEENSITNIYTQNFYKVQKYLTISDHGYIGYIVVVSKRFWDSLPERLKKIVIKALNEVTQKERQLAEDLNTFCLNKIVEYSKKSGKLEIIYLTDKEKMIWKKRFMRMYESYDYAKLIQ